MTALLFDFDGLMLDSELCAFRAWSAIYAEHGATLALERWVACVGTADAVFDPVHDLAALLGPERGARLDRAALFAEKERRKREACDRLALMPGIEPLVAAARARGLKIAVASSSGRAWVAGHLQRLGVLDRFDAVRTAEDVRRTKPAPDLFLAAAAAVGCAPRDCVALEDSLNGVRAAKAAGMRCFAVPNQVTQGLDFAEADGVFSTLAGVPLSALFPSEHR